MMLAVKAVRFRHLHAKRAAKPRGDYVMNKRKYTVKHYWCVDNTQHGFGISEALLGTYTTYATSDAKAISNIRYRLGISFMPYDIGDDMAGCNDLRCES